MDHDDNVNFKVFWRAASRKETPLAHPTMSISGHCNKGNSVDRVASAPELTEIRS